MKRKEYNLRLLRFANHLSKLEIDIEPDLDIHFLNWEGEFENLHCEVRFNMNFFRELPYVFPEDWTNAGFYSDMFGPLLIHGRKLCVVYGVGKFFNLNCKAVRFCFDVSGKCGNDLYYNSSAKDVASNIFKLIDEKKK